jgi:hypothetical protein
MAVDGPYTDTGTGAYPNPPAEVTYGSAVSADPTGLVEGPPAEVTVESPVGGDPTGAAPNPPAEQTTYEWPATAPQDTPEDADTKAVTADEPGVENKAVTADEASTPNFDAMTKAQLQDHADQNSIAGVDQSSQTKAEMIDTINATG